MSKNVTITWDLPTTREDGSPLPVEDIANVVVSLKVDNLAAPWTMMGTVEPTNPDGTLIPQGFTAGDVDIGDWLYRLVVNDIQGQPSPPVDTAFSVASDAGPSIVMNVAISQA